MANEAEPAGTLPVRMRCLAALGSALATQREYQIASHTPPCLEAGATPGEVMEVFRLATVMAE